MPGPVIKPSSERRQADRFPLDREVRFRVLDRSAEEAGVGRTLNMSSGGVLFATDQTLVPGRRVELSISWPAQLNDSCPLKLVARGRVVRTEESSAAIALSQYEFRTASRKPAH